MQMSGSPHQMGRSPPTPMVQTPVISAANAVPPVFPEPTSQTQATQQEQQQQAQTANVNNVAESNEGHARNISQSSNQSSVPELVPVNANVIVNNANPINNGK